MKSVQETIIEKLKPEDEHDTCGSIYTSILGWLLGESWLIPFVEQLKVLPEGGVCMVYNFVSDEADPWELVARYARALAPGSYLAISHATYDNVPARSVQAGREEYSRASEQFHFRSRAQIARLFDGLEIVPPRQGARPDLVYLGEWGAEDPVMADSDGSRWGYCAVVRRP